ncbi:MAG TPA: HAMP domain-containing sensor histidine kinase [Anaerolineales bacterium]|nr:HAMP domain-containing sensor histidine kinase [Anaerolineales bacterium]
MGVFKRPWLMLVMIFLPIAAGALLSVLLQTFGQPVPVLVFKMDIGTLLLFAGAFLTLIVAALYAGVQLQEREARTALQKALRDAERSRVRFLRRLDHEIKNPLTGLQAALTNLRESGSVQERERAAQNAVRAVERLSRLLADLRKLSDLSERPAERLPVDVPKLLEEMVDAAHSHPRYAGRTINLMVTRVPWNLPAVTGDRDLLGLAIYNLIDNALKFTAAGDSVEVRALEDGRAIIVEVADTGPGIAPDDLHSIFEELYRGANARGVEGSGLGLALTQRIVDLHGGQIAVRSHQSEPRGTIFTLRLPISGG